MYLSNAAKDMLLQLAEDGEVDYKLLHTNELLAILELERKGLIKEVSYAKYQSGNGNKKRCNRNKKAIYAELYVRFFLYFRLFLTLFLGFFLLYCSVYILANM